MAAIYGHRWSSAYGDADDGTWAAALSRFSPTQIGRGIDICIRSGEDWPPALPTFRRFCLGVMEVEMLSDTELVSECLDAGINTTGRSRKYLESTLKFGGNEQPPNEPIMEWLPREPGEDG